MPIVWKKEFFRNLDNKNYDKRMKNEWTILDLLLKKYPSGYRFNEIARKVTISRTPISNILTCLESDGLIVRKSILDGSRHIDLYEINPEFQYDSTKDYDNAVLLKLKPFGQIVMNKIKEVKII